MNIRKDFLGLLASVIIAGNAFGQVEEKEPSAIVALLPENALILS